MKLIMATPRMDILLVSHRSALCNGGGEERMEELPIVALNIVRARENLRARINERVFVCIKMTASRILCVKYGGQFVYETCVGLFHERKSSVASPKLPRACFSDFLMQPELHTSLEKCVLATNSTLHTNENDKSE